MAGRGVETGVGVRGEDGECSARSGGLGRSGCLGIMMGGIRGVGAVMAPDGMLMDIMGGVGGMRGCSVVSFCVASFCVSSGELAPVVG
jgi:hypothetical protein